MQLVIPESMTKKNFDQSNHSRGIVNLILYASKDASRNGTVLKRQIGRQVKTQKIQTIQTFNAFKARLKQISVYDKEIFILLADTKNRLKIVLSMRFVLSMRQIFFNPI